MQSTNTGVSTYHDREDLQPIFIFSRIGFLSLGSSEATSFRTVLTAIFIKGHTRGNLKNLIIGCTVIGRLYRAARCWSDVSHYVTVHLSLSVRRTPNSQPRPERVCERGKNRTTYHPLRDQTQFMIPKNQSVPEVAQHTLPVVYAAAKVTGGCLYRPNRGQNPYPWSSPRSLAAIDDVAQGRADQNEEQISRTRKQKEQYVQPRRIQRETEDGADHRDEHHDD